MRREAGEHLAVITGASMGIGEEFARQLAARGAGLVLVARSHDKLEVLEARIINVASTASFQPVPYMAVYGATKAYVLSFTEALSEELRESGVRVIALCPGPTDTNFSKSNAVSSAPFRRSGQTVQEVVAMGLKAGDAGRVVCVTQQKLLIIGERLLPRWAIRRMAAAFGKAFVRHV